MKQASNSLPDLQDVVRDAVMREHGDQWSVEEFMALYLEKNVSKKMYQRISTPPEGFLRIIPSQDVTSGTMSSTMGWSST